MNYISYSLVLKTGTTLLTFLVLAAMMKLVEKSTEIHEIYV